MYDSIDPAYVAAAGVAFKARMLALDPYFLVEQTIAGYEPELLPEELEREQVFQDIWGISESYICEYENKHGFGYKRPSCEIQEITGAKGIHS